MMVEMIMMLKMMMMIMMIMMMMMMMVIEPNRSMLLSPAQAELKTMLGIHKVVSRSLDYAYTKY